jgi:protein-disulfide isomerase
MSVLSVPVNADDHSQGEADAGCTLVEYGDYECPHCGHAHSIVKRLQKHFGKQLRFVYRNFPLTQIHPQAEPAAEVAEFAGAHGKFWEMHDLLFENQDGLGPELYEELAGELKLPLEDLREAIAEGKYRTRVRADFSGGVRSGVNGTPTFFINGTRHNGPFEYEFLLEAIEGALEDSKG